MSVQTLNNHASQTSATPSPFQSAEEGLACEPRLSADQLKSADQTFSAQ